MKLTVKHIGLSTIQGFSRQDGSIATEFLKVGDKVAWIKDKAWVYTIVSMYNKAATLSLNDNRQKTISLEQLYEQYKRVFTS